MTRLRWLFLAIFLAAYGLAVWYFVPVMAAEKGLTTDQLFELAKQKALIEGALVQRNLLYDNIPLIIGAIFFGLIQLYNVRQTSKIKTAVDGITTARVEAAESVGEAKGKEVERQRGEAVAEVIAAKTDIIVERARATVTPTTTLSAETEVTGQLKLKPVKRAKKKGKKKS